MSKPTKTVNAPAPSTNYEVTQINLDKELRKLLEKEGLPMEALDEMMKMKRGDYYTASIRAYYHGSDEGFNKGLVKGLQARYPWWVWFGAGFVSFVVIKFGWKLLLLCIAIYNG